MAPPYLLHKNGRGRLYDDAEANQATFLSRNSSVLGYAKLRDCQLLEGSRAEDNCQIYGGRFSRTIIRGRTIVAGDPQVENSLLDCAEVSGTPRIRNCLVLKQTEICDCPVLEGITCENAVIYGAPTISGSFVVTGRVHEGTWDHPPRHCKLPWCSLSECVSGKLLLNCYCRPVTWWLRFGPRVGAKWDWSTEMIRVTLEVIEREFCEPS